MKYEKTEILTFALCAAIILTVLYILGHDVGSSRFNHSSWSRTSASEKGKPARHGTAIPVSCRQVGTSVICGGREYKDVTWKYDIKTITAVVTAYDAHEFPGINARGIKPIVGSSVACPRRIKLGNSIILEGRSFTCDDRTAKKFDGRFDLFVRTRAEALAWGKRTEAVTIINP